MRHIKTTDRMRERVDSLIDGFADYCKLFDEENQFVGPSLFFHLKTIDSLRKYSSPALAIENDQFLENIYATLTAWGMHRMGPGNTKLVDFDVMAKSIRSQSKQIEALSPLRLLDLSNGEQVKVVGLSLWEMLSTLTIGIGETKIVVGSKTLHHILPELIPPIDRTYTLKFFYNNTTLSQGDRYAFLEIFPYFHEIGVSCRPIIESRIGKGMNTSTTKVIDNAIVGYCIEHFKRGSGNKEAIESLDI